MPYVFCVCVWCGEVCCGVCVTVSSCALKNLLRQHAKKHVCRHEPKVLLRLDLKRLYAWLGSIHPWWMLTRSRKFEWKQVSNRDATAVKLVLWTGVQVEQKFAIWAISHSKMQLRALNSTWKQIEKHDETPAVTFESSRIARCSHIARHFNVLREAIKESRKTCTSHPKCRISVCVCVC